MNFKKLLINSTMLITAGLAFVISTNTHQVKAASSNQDGTITIRFDGARVYNKNGEQMDSYPGAETYLEKALIKEGTTVNYYGKPVYMNWHNNDENKKAIFYNIGKGGYVLGYNIASLNGKGTLSVYRNSYVYDKNGKRLSTYQGSRANTLIRKGTAVNYVGKLNEMPNTDKNMPKFYYFNKAIQRLSDKMLWPTYRTIKGKQYYNIGDGGYIKAINIGYINGVLLRASEATVTIGKAWSDDGKYYARTSKGKVTKTVLPFKEGQKIIVDRKLISGRTFWRIKGSNKYIFGPDIKTFPLQSLRY